MDTAIAESAAPVSSSTESSATATPETRPTFQQAFAAETPPITDPAATAQTEPGAIATTEAKGPIPFEVHHKALENARTKAVDEAIAKHREQFGWAETLDRQAVEEAQRLGQLYTTDRAGYVKQLMADALTDPTLAPIVRSEAARVLAAARGAQAPSLEPDIPVFNEQGQQVSQTFSAGKQLELIKHLVAEALGKEVGPLKQDFATRQDREHADQQQRELSASVEDIYAEAVSILPHFEEHKDAIGKVFATLSGDPAKALRQAWSQVVAPKLAAKANAEVLDTLKTKAAAASGVNPAGAVIATTKRPTSLTDKSLKW